MNNTIMQFNFNNFQLEMIENDGEPWFIARPLVEFLGYQNPAEAIRTNCDEEDVRKIYIPIKSNNYVCVNESGLYCLVVRSNKQEARVFSRWVTKEVLPSIRKTGSYSSHSEASNIETAAKLFPALAAAFESVGIKGNQLALAVDKSAKSVTGVTLLGIGEVTLISPKKEQSLPPKAIGSELGMSAQAINKFLVEHGFQTSHRDHHGNLYYVPTESGDEYCEVVDTNKKHSDGTPIKQLKWYSGIIDVIKGLLNKAA